MRMLDVNPKTRITMEGIIEHGWTNEGYETPIERGYPSGAHSLVPLLPCQACEPHFTVFLSPFPQRFPLFPCVFPRIMYRAERD